MLVYVHGNCQARAIAQMLAPRFPEWDITYYEVFKQEIVDESARYRSLVAAADVIIAQPIHRGYRDREDLSLEWVRGAARPSTPIVVFPSMYFGGQLIGWASLPIPGYGMEYHDSLLVKLVSAGLPTEKITRILLSAELYDDAFITREIQLSIAEIVRREQADAVDVKLSPFLKIFGMDVPLFHVINHPCRPALAYVANNVLLHLGYKKSVSEMGEDHIKFPHIPCSPSMARFFAQRGNVIPEWQIENGERYHLPHEQIDPAEYIMRAANHVRGYQPEVLQSCADDHRAAPFLARAALTIPHLKALGAPSATAKAGHAPDDIDALRELVMKFESLGGTGHGCEFGLFQREFGAEPLGLLRWADLGHDLLTAALIARFEGVGEPAFTEVFVPFPNEWNEWWTRDTRYWMAMRGFVQTKDVSHEAMQRRIAMRQRFLRKKLIADLHAGEKIFVYKNLYETISGESLARLHRALCVYGKNVLLYIAYEDAEHPNGTVEVRAPGLLVGYIDHFGFSPENQKLEPATASLMAICRRVSCIVASGAAYDTEDRSHRDEVVFGSVDHCLALAAEAQECDDPEAALQIWAAIRRREPGHSAPYLRAAALLARLGRHDEVEEVLVDGIRNSPGDMSLSIGYAMIPHKRGDRQQAVRRWSAAHTLFPFHPAIFPHYLSLLDATGGHEEAAALRVQATTITSNAPDDNTKAGYIIARDQQG